MLPILAEAKKLFMILYGISLITLLLMPTVKAATPQLEIINVYFRSNLIQHAKNRIYIEISSPEQDFLGKVSVSYGDQKIIADQTVSIIKGKTAGCFADVTFKQAGELPVLITINNATNKESVSLEEVKSIQVVGDNDADGVINTDDPDDDNDGIPDVEELNLGTSPWSADTDGDGVIDPKDDFPKDPLETIDTDNDGIGNNADTDDDGDTIPDTKEKELGTEPLKKDTDGDGLSDNIEFDNGTDPNDSDTDNDGISDAQDKFPNNPDKTYDDDQDGLTNDEENAAGLNPNNPDDANKDSDGDGISNSDEILKYATNPQSNDSDNDGISDLKEIENGLDPLDPTDAKADNDRDGISNRLEVTINSDINRKNSYWWLLLATIVIVFLIVKNKKIKE